MKFSSQLGLGTVQWGLPYGVMNSAGQTSPKGVGEILSEAQKLGVKVLDTSCQYGSAEKVLGQNSLNNFKVITKTLSFGGIEISTSHVDKVFNTFRKSLAHMSCDSLYGLLIHRADDLLLPGGCQLIYLLERIKAEGLVSKIGVSVYDGSQVDAILNLFLPDIVQLPLNVLDQRLLLSGHIALLKDLGVEIHARSVFLQGLLLAPVDSIPSYFQPIRENLMRWQGAVLKKQKLSLTQAALAFVRDCPGVDVVLVGVDNVDHFKTCFSDFTVAPSFDASGLACEDAKFLNPNNWIVH